MSGTQTEVILAAAATILTGAAIGASVTRSRVVPFARDQLPAVVLKPAEDESTPLAAALDDHLFDLELEVHTRGDAPDSLADPIIAAAHKALMADPTLGGACSRLHHKSRKWEFDDADRAACKVVVTYVVRYATVATDLGRQP
jgi:hypothetical protein